MHQDFADQSGDISGDLHDIGAHAPVAGPGRLQIVNPELPPDNRGNSDRYGGDRETPEQPTEPAGGHPCRTVADLSEQSHSTAPARCNGDHDSQAQ